VRQEERNNHGYIWEFFKEHIELEFIPKNSNYISKCKLCDLVNTLHQYVRVHIEFLLETQHMHELD
jgi:hypothetical protein